MIFSGKNFFGKKFFPEPLFKKLSNWFLKRGFVVVYSIT